jgi:hypothetical protein
LTRIFLRLVGSHWAQYKSARCQYARLLKYRNRARSPFLDRPGARGTRSAAFDEGWNRGKRDGRKRHEPRAGSYKYVKGRGDLVVENNVEKRTVNLQPAAAIIKEA